MQLNLVAAICAQTSDAIWSRRTAPRRMRIGRDMRMLRTPLVAARGGSMTWTDYCLSRRRRQAARVAPLGRDRRRFGSLPYERPMCDATAAVHAVPVDAATLPMRPREKLCHRGSAALTDAELLALLIGSGTTGRSAMRIARSVARRPPGELAR